MGERDLTNTVSYTYVDMETKLLQVCRFLVFGGLAWLLFLHFCSFCIPAKFLLKLKLAIFKVL